MTDIDAFSALLQRNVSNVWPDEVMARHTGFRIGGQAKLYVECDTMDELVTTIEVAGECGLDWTILGKGTNVLIADEGYDGIIITLGREFKRHEVLRDEATGRPRAMVCGAAVALGSLVQEAVKTGYSGFEFAVGIPGSLGGAVLMNAGTKEATIGQVCRSIVVYRPDSGLHRYAGEELPWHYRYSGLPAGEIVLEAEIAIEEASTAFIQAKMEGILKRRRKTQPIGVPNAGSIFRNPPDDSAGRLIEACGFKGMSIGGAQVSETHANFIINTGHATARDVVMLMTKIRKRVREEYGIELKPEIKFLGFRQ